MRAAREALVVAFMSDDMVAFGDHMKRIRVLLEIRKEQGPWEIE